MLSGPSAGKVLCGHYNNVSFDVGKSMPRREQIVKVSFDVGEARLTSEQQMEQIRMKMLEMKYRRWYSKGLESFHTFSPDTSGSCVPMQSADFASMLGEIWSEDDNLQLHATTLIKKFLSIEGNCPTTLVKSGVIGRFAHFLMRNDFLQLQYEAAWALIKIACGTSGKTKTEFVCEAVPYFVRLLDSPSYDACELGVFALGIVAHDSRNDRDFVLSNGVLVPLLKLLEKHAFLGNQANLSMLRNVTWTLSIFCRDISERHYKQVKPALTTLGRLLHSDDEEVLINSCWAIHGLFYEGFGKIQALMGAGLCPKLVKHLLHSSRRVQIPVLMTVGLISSKKTHIQALIKNGTLGPLLTLLTEGPKAEDPQDGDRLIKRDACAVISRILRGKERQIQAVIDANFFGPLVKHLESPDLDLQEEAARAISFAISYGSRMQIEYLVNEWKIINHISNLLTCENNPTAVQLALKVVKDLLEAGSSKQDLGSNPYAQLIAEAQCVEKMKLILEEQWRFNHEILWEAKFIMMDFFKDVLGMGGKIHTDG